MRLAIDFDGVLCDGKNVEAGRRMGNPVNGARAAMERLRKDGHHLIVHSVRGGRPGHVRDWLRFYSVPFDEITNVKPNDVAFFVDDHGLRFEGDWTAAIEEMYRLDKEYRAGK